VSVSTSIDTDDGPVPLRQATGTDRVARAGAVGGGAVAAVDVDSAITDVDARFAPPVVAACCGAVSIAAPVSAASLWTAAATASGSGNSPLAVTAIVVTVGDVTVGDVTVGDVTVGDVTAGDVSVRDVMAGDGSVGAAPGGAAGGTGEDVWLASAAPVGIEEAAVSDVATGVGPASDATTGRAGAVSADPRPDRGVGVVSAALGECDSLAAAASAEGG
jgi:hypothetical protein